MIPLGKGAFPSEEQTWDKTSEKEALQLECMGSNQMQLVSESKTQIISSTYTRKGPLYHQKGSARFYIRKRRHLRAIALWSEPEYHSILKLWCPAYCCQSLYFPLHTACFHSLLTSNYPPWSSPSLTELPLYPWVWCTCLMDSTHSLFQKCFPTSQFVEPAPDLSVDLRLTITSHRPSQICPPTILPCPILVLHRAQ